MSSKVCVFDLAGKGAVTWRWGSGKWNDALAGLVRRLVDGGRIRVGVSLSSRWERGLDVKVMEEIEVIISYLVLRSPNGRKANTDFLFAGKFHLDS